MKLTKKHIGGLFHVRGSDGSWAYQLLDVKKGILLFYVFGSYPFRYESEPDTHHDWEAFKPQKRDPMWDKGAWEQARFTK